MTVLKHNGTRAIGQQAAAQIARWDNIFSLYYRQFMRDQRHTDRKLSDD